MIELLVVIAIIAVLIALLLPAVQQAREAARRTQCKNNLMQIALALHNYEMAYESLPPGSVDPNRPIRNEGKGYHVGWMLLLLPYLEQGTTFARFDFSAGVYDPINAEPRAVSIPVYMCPSNPWIGPAKGATTYAGCHHDAEAPIDIDNNGVLYLNSSVRYRDVRDGASNTIYVGEHGDVDPLGWASGTRATLRNTGSFTASPGFPRGGPAPPNVQLAPAGGDAALLTVGGFSSAHVGGANFAIGDGAIRFISQNISPTVFKGLGNRAGGELPTDF